MPNDREPLTLEILSSIISDLKDNTKSKGTIAEEYRKYGLNASDISCLNKIKQFMVATNTSSEEHPTDDWLDAFDQTNPSALKVYLMDTSEVNNLKQQLLTIQNEIQRLNLSVSSIGTNGTSNGQGTPLANGYPKYSRPTNSIRLNQVNENQAKVTFRTSLDPITISDLAPHLTSKDGNAIFHPDASNVVVGMRNERYSVYFGDIKRTWQLPKKIQMLLLQHFQTSHK